MGRKDGPTKERTDGRTDEWTDGTTDGRRDRHDLLYRVFHADRNKRKRHCSASGNDITNLKKVP